MAISRREAVWVWVKKSDVSDEAYQDARKRLRDVDLPFWTKTDDKGKE